MLVTYSSILHCFYVEYFTESKVGVKPATLALLQVFGALLSVFNLVWDSNLLKSRDWSTRDCPSLELHPLVTKAMNQTFFTLSNHGIFFLFISDKVLI